MAIDLEFITTARVDEEGNHKISGIPDELWEVFCEAAREAMPEKGKLAWASVLTEIIQKHVEGNVYTFIMTDIPQEARKAFEKTSAQADLTMDHVIGVMFKSAMKEELHIINMISQASIDTGYRTILITGLSNTAWKEWHKAALGVHLAPEELIGQMFEAAATGTLTLTEAPQNENEHKFQSKETVQ